MQSVRQGALGGKEGALLRNPEAAQSSRGDEQEDQEQRQVWRRAADRSRDFVFAAWIW